MYDPLIDEPIEHKKSMKINLLVTVMILIVGSFIPAQAGTKEDVKSAIKKLAEKGNYSWTSTSKRPERPENAEGDNNRVRSGPTEGKTVGDMIFVKSNRGERSFEFLTKGEKVAIKGEDGWSLIEPRQSNDATGTDDQARERRRRGLSSYLRNYKTPSVRAEEFLAKVGDLKKDGDAYSGELTEEGAKSLVSFWSRPRGDDGGDATERPQPTGVKASAKFWVKDGFLTKYESVVAGKIIINGNERDLGRTTTVEIKDAGSTKIDVPDDFKNKLSTEDGFASIFNGKDEPKVKKEGTWTTFTGNGMSVKTEGNWQVQKDGSLYLEPRPGEKGWTRYGSYLWLTEDYEDFVFSFEYQHGKGGNSGLYFRIYDESDATAHGFEVQILDCYGKKKLGQHDLGGVIQTAGPLTNASKPAGEWNLMQLTMSEGKVSVVLNGKKVQDNLDLEAKKPKGKKLAGAGKIAIQDHGLKFSVRNLRVKKL